MNDDGVGVLVRLAALVLSPLLALGGVVGAAQAAEPSQRWEVNEPGAWLQWSSPVIVDLDGDGSQDVVVGGLNGRLYAYDAAGRPLPGWAGGVATTGAVASSPAVAALDGDGRKEVIVGVGALEVPGERGGLDIIEADGTRRCSMRTPDARYPEQTEGTAVWNAPAIGDVDGDGHKDITFGSFDHIIRVVDAHCGTKGTFDAEDSLWSSPALYDVDGDGADEIFIGTDASRDPVTGRSHDGGLFRSLRWKLGSRTAAGYVNLVPRWTRSSAETFQSGAAIADLDGDGRPEVVTGSGAYWCRWKNQCADSNKVWAFHLDDGSDVPGWPRQASLETTFLAAPAIGDVDGDGKLDVVVGTNSYDRSGDRSPSGGAVDVFYGDRQKPRATWTTSDVEVVAPPVIADVNGSGTPEVLVSSAGRVTVLGPDLQVLDEWFTGATNRKASVAVGQLGDAWGVVSTGFTGDHDGSVVVRDIPPPTSLPWPMHRHDAARTGQLPVAPPRSGFLDVFNGSVYSEAVRAAVDRGVTGGCRRLAFCADTSVSRAQAVTFLSRGAGSPSLSGPDFQDVPSSAYFAPAVRWAQSRGVTAGCSTTSFCPGRAVTRGELVTLLWRLAGRPDAATDLSFADVPTSAFYAPAVSWAVGAQITQGVDAVNFAPLTPVTRGQTVLFLARSR